MSGPYTSVVYLALGEFRIAAALSHSAALAESGAKVTLVASDRPEWKDARLAAGVTLVRAGEQPWKTVRPLLATGVDLLLAGDPESMPVADAARRSFPALEIRTEPTLDPGRRPVPADLAVVTPWYPSPNDPFAGAFVQAAVQSLRGDAGSVSILHAEHWFYPPWRLTGNLIDITTQRELARSGGVTVTDVPEGELTRVVAPQPRRMPYAVWADEQVRRMRTALPTGRIEAPLVHAHTGHFGGVMAVELARPDARIFVTEHATFIKRVFAQPAAREQYRTVLARAEAVFCVSRHLRQQIVDEFPQYAHKVLVMPNPIDFDHFAVRPTQPERPRRWLYAGRMLDHKGVLTLVDGFAAVAAKDPDVTLTLVGNGKIEDIVRGRIRKLGLTDRVAQRPPVAPNEMTALMHDHDLLVHASRVETFGMTVVEAIATGTPVLVAESEGPAETLRGLDGVAGTLFPVTKDPKVLVEAYQRLCDLWPKLDLAAARARLRERYGYAAVGEQLLAAYRQPPTEPAAESPAPSGEPADRIVVVAVYPPFPGRTRAFMEKARAKGFGVDLIVADPGKWAHEAEAGIRVHGVGPQKSEDVTVPRVRLSGSPMPSAVARTLVSKARTLRGKVTGPAAALVRPQVVWRSTRPLLPEIDMSKVRRVIVNGVHGERIGWQIARRYPGVPVDTAFKLPGE
jgi:glycosyltransferase involved in cell wall biosynthesis